MLNYIKLLICLHFQSARAQLKKSSDYLSWPELLRNTLPTPLKYYLKHLAVINIHGYLISKNDETFASYAGTKTAHLREHRDNLFTLMYSMT